ncbi:GNAT family N-acetyltransferase [Colwellia demingiae]|uniref:GNAT family N-acetyltransferase n=1 Tax=Colwellia demingiae TaxID=89401 RepID=A0A5C6Q8R8_9GAMM|nr:GNAT family N-acetyltransferase [Colwellia demingiae]TWX65181.1 GNAT family N-acetyltransferase [Colwellia demingiae]
MIIVETERLSIRQITNEDAINLTKVLADPMVMQYSTVGVHTEKQINDYIANCQNQYDLNGYGHWAIYNSITNEFVGVCGLNKHEVDTDDVIHINYRLATDQQGKGYAVESTFGVLDFAKNTLKLKAVHALIESANISSVKVVDRTGFVFIKPAVFRGFKVDIYQVAL